MHVVRYAYSAFYDRALLTNAVQRVSCTELARNTRRLLSDVQRGRTALIENDGEPEEG